MIAASAESELASGTVVGSYRLIRIIGRGGMGAVYEAENLSIGRRVAIKVLEDAFAKDPVMRARFEREARTAASIAHPNVVEMLDRGTLEPDRPYIVMELLEGEPLRERMQRGALSLGEAAYIGAQILAGLATAHARGVVHRDLKPDNVFLVAHEGDQLFVKLLDFGISKLLGEGVDLHLTSTGSVMGTPRYMSPEQARGQHELDHRVDLFAVGVLLFEMLTGVPPHAGDSYNQLVGSLLERTPPPISSLRPDLPVAVAAMVDLALSRDRDQRPSTADLLDVLRPHVAPHLLGPSLLATPPPARLGPVTTPSASVAPARTPAPLAPPTPASTSSPDSKTECLRGPNHSAAPPAPNSSARPPPRARRVVATVAIGATCVIAAGIGAVRWTRSRAAHVVAAAPVAPDAARALAGAPLRLGVVRWLPRDTMVRDADPLLRYLEQALKRPVALVLLEDYEQSQAWLEKGDLDVLRLMPLAYVKLRARVPGLELLATVVSGGARTYQSVIVTKMGSGLQSLRSLRGKVMCWSSPTSTSGYLFPRALLRKQHLDPDRMFRSVAFSGDHLSSLRAVREGSCDAAGVDSTTFLNAGQEGISPGAFQVVATTDAIPLDVIAAGPALPKPEREAFRAALLAAAPGTPAAASLKGMFLKIDGFVPADDAAYDVVRRVEKSERAARR